MPDALIPPPLQVEVLQFVRLLHPPEFTGHGVPQPAAVTATRPPHHERVVHDVQERVRRVQVARPSRCDIFGRRRLDEEGVPLPPGPVDALLNAADDTRRPEAGDARPERRYDRVGGVDDQSVDGTVLDDAVRIVGVEDLEGAGEDALGPRGRRSRLGAVDQRRDAKRKEGLREVDGGGHRCGRLRRNNRTSCYVGVLDST